MTVIDEYLSTVTPQQKEIFEHIRRLVHEIAPDVEETRSYGMPAFKYKGKYLLSFHAFKDHLSLFPGSNAIAVLQDELKSYKLSKGTIQFSEANPLPDKLVKTIIQHRIDEINSK